MNLFVSQRALLLICTFALLPIAVGHAQDPGTVDELKRQLDQLQKKFEQVVREQQDQINALKKQLDGVSTNSPQLQGSPGASSQREPSQALGPPSAAEPKPVEATERWSPADPIRVGGARNYLDLSLDGLFAAGTSTAEDIQGGTQLGGHDPNQRGFTVQNLETVLEGKVDPYFRAQANLIFQIDAEGESVFEVEEAYFETMSLPWNLQLKGGQFFTEFGRLNPTHPHAWDFVDQPLVNGRFLGPDGLRSAGARLSWLVPTPFYSELFLAVANSQGETAYSFRFDHEGETFLGRPAIDRSVESFGDMLFAPRYAASFNLTDAQTLLVGTSAALGPNSSGSDTGTQIYGVDLFWKWKSPRHHGGFPFVSWQTEAMARRFEAGAYPGDSENPAVPGETLVDFGLYSQVAYGFRRGWVGALRGEYLFPDETGQYELVLGPDPERASRWRISPNLTYYPTEFSKIRLQYNFDRRELVGDDHSVWLQFEFLLGAHAAHKF